MTIEVEVRNKEDPGSTRRLRVTHLSEQFLAGGEGVVIALHKGAPVAHLEYVEGEAEQPS